MDKRLMNVGALALVPVMLMALSVIGGCESKDRADNENRGGADRMPLVFQEASKGLPSSGRWRQGLAFCDINQDGHMDILAPPARLAEEKAYLVPTAWLGDGKGAWSRADLNLPDDLAYDYGGIAAGDFNGDGILDMGLAMHGQGLKALKGKGKLTYENFSSGLPTTSQFASRAVVSADFNQDGIADMAGLSEGKFGDEFPPANGVRVCYGGKDGWTCRAVGEGVVTEVATEGLFGDQLTTGDVNGDGRMDIAVSTFEHTRDLIVWLNDGKGGFTPFNQGLPQQVHYLWVDLQDVDGDGRDDLIASISGLRKDAYRGIRVFLSGPEGFKEMTAGGLPSKEVFFAVQACDLDNDGQMEIVGGSGTGAIAVFSLKGGEWQRLQSVPGLPKTVPGRISGLYCRDLNGDGRKDIVVNFSGGGNKKAGGIRVFLNITGQGPE